MKTFTASALETAVRNASKMDTQNYTITQDKVVDTFYHVRKNQATCYFVQTFEGFESCSCPQFKNENICKHQKFVADHIRILQMEADFEARFDY